MSLTKKTAGGFLWLGGVKATNAILQFAILAILARLLSPTEFGLMGLALTVVSFSDIFIDMGFGPAITQKEKLSKTDLHTSFTYSLIFGSILVFIIWLFAPAIASFFRNDDLIPILKVISIVLFLRAGITTPLGLMYRELEFKKLSLIQITSYALGYGVVGVTLAYLGYGVWSLVIAVISQTVLSLILYWTFNRKSIGFSLNKQSFKELIHFGGGYSLSKIFSYGGNQGDKIMIGRILGVEAVGLYDRGYQVVKYSASLIGEIIDKVLFSPIARKQNDRELVKNIFLEMTYIFGIIFMPLSAFIYNNADAIVHIILGNQWDNTIPIVKAMSFVVFFLITTRISSTIAKSLGDVYRRAWRTLFYAILVLIGVYIGSRWGVVGVAIAVVLVKLIDYTLAFAQVAMLTSVKYFQFLEAHILGVVLFGIYFVLYWVVDKFILIYIDNVFITLVIGGVVLLITYALVLVLDFKKTVKKYYSILLKRKKN